MEKKVKQNKTMKYLTPYVYMLIRKNENLNEYMYFISTFLF